MLKYAALLTYLNAYATVAEAKTGIGAWLDFYNEERQHQSLGYRTLLGDKQDEHTARQSG